LANNISRPQADGTLASCQLVPQRQPCGDGRRGSIALASSRLQPQPQQQQQQQQQVIAARHRTGSNPLDRANCKMSPHQVAHLIRHTQAAPAGRAPPPNWAGKRHSIINLLAASVGQTTSNGGGSSLNKRRSLAGPAQTNSSTADNNNNNNNNNNNARQKARRLTSGAELTTTTASGPDQHLTAAGTMRSLTNELVANELNASGQYDPLIPESGFKIVVMGTSGSGKTAIIHRFLYGTFSSRHSPTVEDTYFIEFPHKKNTINISVSDTSGKSSAAVRSTRADRHSNGPRRPATPALARPAGRA
jgi:hypothetical protein